MEGGDPAPNMSSGMRNDKIYFKLTAPKNTNAPKSIIGKIKLPWKNGNLKLVKNSEIPCLTKNDGIRWRIWQQC